MAQKLRKEHRGKGYGTKGPALTLEVARKILPEDEICLRVLKSNIPSFKVISNNLYFHLSNVKFTIYEYSGDYFTDYGAVTASNFHDYELENASSSKIEYTLYYSSASGAFFPFSVTFSNNKLYATA